MRRERRRDPQRFPGLPAALPGSRCTPVRSLDPPAALPRPRAAPAAARPSPPAPGAGPRPRRHLAGGARGSSLARPPQPAVPAVPAHPGQLPPGRAGGRCPRRGRSLGERQPARRVPLPPAPPPGSCAALVGAREGPPDVLPGREPRSRLGSARVGWARLGSAGLGGRRSPRGRRSRTRGNCGCGPGPAARPRGPGPPGSAVPQRERIAEQPVLGREEPSSEQLPLGRVLLIPPQKRLMALYCQVWFVGSVLSSFLDQVHQYFSSSCFAKWCL